MKDFSWQSISLHCNWKQRKRIQILFSFALIFCTSNYLLQAQKTIQGHIKSSTDIPLIGASILEEGTSNGTLTDIDGNFTLSLKDEDATIVISYLGYLTQQIEVGNQSTFSIEMEEDVKGLEEVIVVGYGTQKKSNLTGAISSVDLSDAKNRPIANATQALAGLASGVSVQQRSGRPGDDGAEIRIRGIGTLGRSDPLVLVDGIRESLGNVNVADIESITVLKDAASAAIYGSRAANGVILVTTKTGRRSDELKVSYTGYAGYQKATKLTDYVTNSVTFMESINLATKNRDPNANLLFSEETVNAFRNGNDPILYPNTDWQDIMYRNGFITSHNANINGGGEKTAFAFSLGYLNQEGILLGTSTEQFTGRLNIDTRVNDKLSFSAKLSGRFDKVNEPVAGAGTVTGWVNRALPMQSPHLADGRYASPWVGFPNPTHPLAGVTEGYNYQNWDNLLTNLSGTYEIIEGLTIQGTAGMRLYHNLNKVFRPDIKLYNPSNGNTLQQSVGGNPLSAWNRYNTQRELTLLTTVNYEKFLGDHYIKLLGGFSQETSKFHRLEASKNNLPSNALTEITAGSVDPTAEGYLVDFGLQSYFGRFNYNFQEKYLFEANMRYDGSSNFGEGNKWGLFPSFSAGWNLAKEPFFTGNGLFDEFKIRASWGQLGNQNIDPNQYATIYQLGQEYSFGGTLVGGAAQTGLANPDITWETSTQTDFGIDVTALEGRLSVTMDYYIKNTDDILRGINISGIIGGLSAPTVNLASVRNKGIEIFANYRDYIGELSYSIGGNLTTIDNEITNLPTPQINAYDRLEEGRSINEFYTIKMLGIFQDQGEIDAHGAQPNAKPGDIKFEDFNNDGAINDADRQPIGQSIPDLLYGFDLNLGYKGFDFSMIWQGVEGILARTEEEQKPFQNSAGLPRFWLENAWTAENPNNNYPRLLIASDTNTGSQSYINSSFLLEDASFLRLKNIQLGYTVPKDLLSQIKLDQLRLYVNASNPLTFTEYRGLDPEKNPLANRGSYSNVKVFTLGLNLSF